MHRYTHTHTYTHVHTAHTHAHTHAPLNVEYDIYVSLTIPVALQHDQLSTDDGNKGQ